jgi:hypothetical protein
MKATGYYVLAGVLVLATVPIYRFILNRGAQAEPVTAVAHWPAAVSASPAYLDCDRTPADSNCVALANWREAEVALRAGRAKCVAGVVYRTSGHVIEPWPGQVACDDPGGLRSRQGV